MISRKEKQAASDPVTQSYENMENQIMQNIIRHVRNYGQLIDSDDWLMQKLAEIGKLNQENIRIIARAAGAQQAEVRKMCYEVADTVTKRLDQTLNQSAAQKRSPNVEKAIRTVHKQARDSLNLTNTRMLYSAQEAYKQLVRTVFEKSSDIAKRKEFLNILGEHATAEASGAESRGQAIRSAVREFNDKGIPALVDKAGRQWTPEAYVSMTLRTTAGNVATEAMLGRMDDLGLNLIQVSSHSGARPKCARDQGKIFDKNNKSGYVEDIDGKKHRYYPLSSSSYGEPDGLFGINCGHHGTPFLPGVSSARYEPTKDLKENDEEYQKMQMQRGLERSIRKQKRLCALYDEIGDAEAFEEAVVKLKSKEAALKNYTAKNGLIRRKDREQVFGFDRQVSAKAVVSNKSYTKAQKTDTISLKDTVIHKSVGAKARNYKVVDKTTGIEYEFSPGTRIQNSEVFAGKGTRHSLHDGVAEGLTEQYGGKVSEWQHAKGYGTLIDPDTGEKLSAEVHWFQEKSVGKVKFKVKEWLNED